VHRDAVRRLTPLDGMGWNAVPMHTGKPWFLPVVGAYYRVKDMVA
jgi:hypothetical protein